MRPDGIYLVMLNGSKEWTAGKWNDANRKWLVIGAGEQRDENLCRIGNRIPDPFVEYVCTESAEEQQNYPKPE